MTMSDKDLLYKLSSGTTKGMLLYIFMVASFQVRAALDMFTDKVIVYRIGDKQSDKLKIPAGYKDKIFRVEKYCTKPELEMLLIIAEGLVEKYDKVKSKMNPKAFAKSNIKLGKKNYNNSTSFFRDYFGDAPEILVQCIKDYKMHNGSHNKDEYYLADLLR